MTGSEFQFSGRRLHCPLDLKQVHPLPAELGLVVDELVGVRGGGVRDGRVRCGVRGGDGTGGGRIVCQEGDEGAKLRVREPSLPATHHLHHNHQCQHNYLKYLLRINISIRNCITIL